MNGIFIILFMLFMHVFDDYVLQGCLANLKQKIILGEKMLHKKSTGTITLRRYLHIVSVGLFALCCLLQFCLDLMLVLCFW